MNYLTQICITINKDKENYNKILIDEFDILNIFLNGVLQKENKDYIIENNYIIFDTDNLKEEDYLVVKIINNLFNNNGFNNQVIQKKYNYNNNNSFQFDDKLDIKTLINIFINGLLQNKDYELILENNKIIGIKLNCELKINDEIMIEYYK